MLKPYGNFFIESSKSNSCQCNACQYNYRYHFAIPSTYFSLVRERTYSSLTTLPLTRSAKMSVPKFAALLSLVSETAIRKYFMSTKSLSCLEAAKDALRTQFDISAPDSPSDFWDRCSMSILTGIFSGIYFLHSRFLVSGSGKGK